MGSMVNEHDDDSEIAWYPRKKIKVVQQKLVGVNPAKILIKELRESQH